MTAKKEEKAKIPKSKTEVLRSMRSKQSVVNIENNKDIARLEEIKLNEPKVQASELSRKMALSPLLNMIGTENDCIKITEYLNISSDILHSLISDADLINSRKAP